MSKTGPKKSAPHTPSIESWMKLANLKAQVEKAEKEMRKDALSRQKPKKRKISHNSESSKQEEPEEKEKKKNTLYNYFKKL